MKLLKKMLQTVVLCPLLVVLALPLLPAGDDTGLALDAVAARNKAGTEEEMRGVWVSSVINLDYPSLPTVSADALKAQADTILDKVAECGFNAVFLQVRPCADALYASDIFPWSVYLTGTQGKAPEDGFDPLAYWVDGAHQRGLELHAWLNPYRITRASSEWAKLAEDSPAKQHPEWTVEYRGSHYFDPSQPEVRDLVIDGALEIAENYAVDGIHLDDYFYPGTDFPDDEAFAASGAADLGDWRRENVNLLISGLDEALHDSDPDIEFGVSPAGIWASNTLNAAGSATTSTYSSYYGMYADSKKWVEQGWVDYIAPQIYWEAGHRTADFTALLDWWCRTVQDTDVRLYIGLADYKTLEAKAADNAWFGGAEIKRQLAACAAAAEVDGAIHFRYGSIAASPALQNIIKSAYSGDAATVSGTVGNTGVTVLLDGERLSFDQQPYIKNGRVMLPMRAVFEALGASVDYRSGRITARKDDTVVRLELGSNAMYINEAVRTLDVAAFAEGGRTFVPLRAVSEAYNCEVDWDNTVKTVSITTGEQADE